MPKVKLNQETVFQYQGITLFPELNEVSNEQLEVLKTAKLSIDFGILELIEEPQAPEVEKKK